MGLLKDIFDWLLDWGGEEVGDVEDILHRPVYPITPYTAVVNPGHLVRGSWPSADALSALKAMGCQKIVNLCEERSQDAEVTRAGLIPVNIPIVDNTVPNAYQVGLFLAVAASGMTYVHCEAGKGRTGCMVAAYRVKVQGWSPKDALAEAERYGQGIPLQEEFILGL